MLLSHNFLIPLFLWYIGKAGSVMSHLDKHGDTEEAPTRLCELVGMLTVRARPVQASGYKAL